MCAQGKELNGLKETFSLWLNLLLWQKYLKQIHQLKSSKFQIFFDAFTETLVFVDDKGVGWNLMQLQGNFWIF